MGASAALIALAPQQPLLQPGARRRGTQPDRHEIPRKIVPRDYSLDEAVDDHLNAFTWLTNECQPSISLHVRQPGIQCCDALHERDWSIWRNVHKVSGPLFPHVFHIHI